MFYLYCVVLHMSEHEFWQSSYQKIEWVLNEYTKINLNNQTQAQEVSSMKDIMGW